MKIYDIIKEDGRIVPGVNTTVDVKPGETERQEKKYFGGNGAPKPLVDKKVLKNSDPNTMYNMGLVEAVVKQSDIERVINNIAARKQDDSFPIRFYDGGTLNVKPSTARKIVDFIINADENVQKYIAKYLPTYNGFKEIANRAGAVQEQEVHEPENGAMLTAPANTIIIDTPGELDWYKIGQHFPTLAQQDAKEFGQSESDMMVTLANASQLEAVKSILTKAGVKFKDVSNQATHPEVHTEEFASDAQRKAAFASGYYPDKKKKKKK